ncbi:MAG: hypothetical protein DCF29_00180 [Alphaproteobacteria bacterium]|uniref:toprim domain-containing protein n=1 Tax=Brevundimonas sp. BAL3 TaxID=391600 RepID=UPI00017EBB0E|nr:toprim domain-containing protein [Brevundimonas sp. BAL3]EDX81783.1 hypothetical protein BBAL3_2940 [Brevundimonas sp. BAL3]PZO09067.1 MAG: hypothetical protein DCF29_00180 [Alphaproteobacteria bacterium]
MSLYPIVTALGGDLYADGTRANVPAPGHSAADRSVSLLLADQRVVIHSFGGADWRIAREDLQRRGLIDAAGRVIGASSACPSEPRPDRLTRQGAASRLWAGHRPLDGSTAAARHLQRRTVQVDAGFHNLGHHPRAPTSVYRRAGAYRPALIARISDEADRLTGVELTYLHRNGRRATELRVSRKTVGLVPPGAAVRLWPADREMLAAEGVITTLSAVERFQLPGWALLAANNLARWTPPTCVRRVLIAADRGAVGQDRAWRLHRRLVDRGLVARVVWPDAPFDDWNAVAMAQTKAERGR